GGGIVVVAVDVSQQADQFGEGLRVEASVFSEAVLGASAELVQRPARFGDADDGDVEITAPDHFLQGGEDLFVGEVAGGAEEDEGVGKRRVLRRIVAGGGVRGGCSAHFCSTWPPNSKRMAESRRSAKSASPRELKRWNRAALRTGEGAPSS